MMRLVSIDPLIRAVPGLLALMGAQNKLRSGGPAKELPGILERMSRKNPAADAQWYSLSGSPKRERGSARPMWQEKLPRSRYGLRLKFGQSECHWADAAGLAFEVE